MNRLLVFFFLNVFASQAQKDPVRLVDIQSSECGGMYQVKPGFIKKETIRDTTFMSLFCSNNCAGYHDPSVNISGDSVLIEIGYGERIMRFKLLNGEYIEEDEIDKHSKDSILEEVTEAIATCDCCYTFELKVTGLNPLINYKYFYNERFIDPEYKPTGVIKEYAFPYFFKQPISEVIENVRRIFSKQQDLLNDLENDQLLIRITADTITGKIKSILTDFELFNKNREINDELKNYFFSKLSINCIKNPFKPFLIQQYWIIFSFNSETNKLEMVYDSGEPL